MHELSIYLDVKRYLDLKNISYDVNIDYFYGKVYKL